jgi:hypothetical protein
LAALLRRDVPLDDVGADVDEDVGGGAITSFLLA